MAARLAQLKRDYLSLSEADRAAFSAWHDGVLRDQRAAAGHASPSAVSAVLLSGGTGKRARLNGVRATLVAGSRRSGWVDVIPHDSTCAIPWRQGGATPAASFGDAPEVATSTSAGALILLLADDQLVEIAKGLDTPSACHYLRACKRLAALEPGRCFTECHLREGLPRGYGVVPSKQLRFARWLASVHAPLRTLHVDLGSGSAEGNVLRWLLQECDTQELSTVKVRIRKAQRGHMTLALYSGSVVVVTESALSAEDVAVEAQLAPFEGAAEGLLTSVLAQTCPALTSLYINDQKDDLKDVPSLGSIKTLKRLEANLGEVRLCPCVSSPWPTSLTAPFLCY